MPIKDYNLVEIIKILMHYSAKKQDWYLIRFSQNLILRINVKNEWYVIYIQTKTNCELWNYVKFVNPIPMTHHLQKQLHFREK